MGIEHWTRKLLGEIIEHPQYGWTTKASPQGQYKYFRTTDINTPIDWDSVPFCKDNPPDPSKYTVKKDDILVSRAGSVGLNIRINDDYPDVVFASYLIRIRALKAVLPRLLEYYLQTQAYWSYISENSTGIAVPNVNATKLADIPILLPPLDEQQKIVERLNEILPRVDAIKTQLNNIGCMEIKLLHSISDLERDNQAVSTLGNYVSECTESIGSDWPSFTKIGVNKDDGIVELRTSKQTGFERYKIVRKGYLVYNPMRVNIGSIALYDKDEIVITSPDYVVFKTKSSIPPVVMLSFLKSPQGLMEINNNTQGAVRERLYFNQLCNINIGTPLIDNAAKYGPVFEWFHKFNSIKPKIEEKLSKLEQSVLAKTFRGELLEHEYAE